jgi:hypothetical protein
MSKISHTILRKNILNVELVSLTGQTWYDTNRELVNWSGSLYIGPNQNDVFYNVTGSVAVGYYKWTGTTWNLVDESEAFDSFNIPLFLESSADEMGGFVDFDGYLEQVEQLVNFTYTQTGSTIEVYSTVNPEKLRIILEQNYTINWGDGNTSGLTVNSGVAGESFPSLVHTYTGSGEYTISVTLTSPWTTEKISKKIRTYDIFTGHTGNTLGTFTGVTVPAYTNLTGQTQDYIYDYDYTSGYTGYTTFTYLALGKSRISEKKLYGSNNYTGVTTGTTVGVDGVWSAYTIDNLYYKDFSDGYTSITGTTSGFTKEEVFNNLLTRNEHFLGFVEDPIIYSDIFVERGKQNVMEKNLRLSEIDNIGELVIYGNGYFNIRKQ